MLSWNQCVRLTVTYQKRQSDLRPIMIKTVSRNVYLHYTIDKIIKNHSATYTNVLCDFIYIVIGKPHKYALKCAQISNFLVICVMPCIKADNSALVVGYLHFPGYSRIVHQR